MSNAELWDLDTSGGIMEQIQMLVAPPVSADALRRSRRRRERDVYRRPGRAVNHDCCDSCKEGGDLICCDKCPAAFHLLCHDPPLTEEDLPTGEWLCHKCKITPQESRDDDTESTSSKSSVRSNRGKRTLVPTIDSDPGSSEHPLRMLAKAARLMNPAQFDVGKEISCNKPLPGSSKRVYGKAAKNLPKKQAHELDNGIVPLPAKICFSCNKSCRVAPLIQCDFCPLLFHLDCLNPPLTSLPTGRWMCPNHVEHFLDSNLLKSQSLTERLRLWDRYTGMVNSHTIKVDFLNKVHRKNPPFRLKRKLPTRSTIAVPAAIKEMYQKRPELLPRPVPDPTTTSVQDLPGTRATYLATLEEQEEWLSGVVTLQSSIAKYLAQRQLQRPFDSLKNTSDIPSSSKPTASVAPVIQKETSEEVSVDPPPSTPHMSDSVKSTLSSSSSSSGSSTSTAQESPDCDTSKPSRALPFLTNGEDKSDTFLGVGSVERPTDFPSSSSSHFSTVLPGGHKSKWTHSTPVNGLDSSLSGQSVDLPNGDMDLTGEVLSWEEGGRPRPDSMTRARSNSTESVPSPSPSDSVSCLEGFHPNTCVTGNCDVPCSHSSKASNVSKVGMVNFHSKAFPSRVTTNSNHIGGNAGSLPRSMTQQTKAATTATSLSSLGHTPKHLPITSLGKSHPLPVSGQYSGRMSPTAQNLLPAIQNLNTALHQWIAEGEEIELSKFDESLTQLLAWQRLQQLMSSKSTPQVPSTGHSTPAMYTDPDSHRSKSSTATSSAAVSGKRGLLNVYLTQQSSTEVRSRAVLCPLSGKGQAISMPYRTLSLGTGADMDVCLSEYGHCNFISGHHATIFYDEMTRHFELLNYSEHGTTVDNVLFSCDFSDKPATTVQTSPLVAAVRDVISPPGKKGSGSSKQKKKDSKEKEQSKDEEEKLKMSAKALVGAEACQCSSSGSSLIGASGAGWEGTALLHHGSYVKLGCLQFVFSIVDHAPDQVPSGPAVASSLSLSSSHHSSVESSLLRGSHLASLPSSLSTASGSSVATSRFSSMPLLSSSQYLHNQPVPTSILKSQLKT